MKTCDSCKAVVDESVSACPKCGRMLEAVSDTEQMQKVDTLLSDANLHKLKGESESAIEKCIEALKLVPDNPDTHSMLGDIYVSTGKLEEAAKWYQMAIDLRPDSEMDIVKLEKIKPRICESQQGYCETTTGGWLLNDTKRDSGLRKIVTFSVIALIVLALFGIAAISLKFGTKDSSADGIKPQKPLPEINQSDTFVTPPPISEETDLQVIARPFIEQDLLSNLATNPAILSRQLIMEDVKIDPRTDDILLTFRMSETHRPKTRTEVLRHAAVAATATFAASSGTAKVEVRALAEYQTSISPREPKLVFIADVTRQVSGLDINKASADELNEFFTRLWWGQELPE